MTGCPHEHTKDGFLQFHDWMRGPGVILLTLCSTCNEVLNRRELLDEEFVAWHNQWRADGRPESPWP
jgi:hypothetical protein